MSCCGRGGSWFKNCGRAGKLHHTWYEGTQACKARLQSKTAVGHQLTAAQQKGVDSSQGAGMENYKTVVIIKTPVFAPVNTSTPMLDVTTIFTSTHTSVSTSIPTQGCVTLLKSTVHINIFYMCILVGLLI